MMKRFSLIFSVLSVGLLGACSHRASLVPGSTVHTHNKDVIVVADAAERDLNNQTAVYPVTFALLENMRQSGVRPRANPALENLKKQYSYKIGSGDVLSVKVWNQPDLNAFSGSAGGGRQTAQGTWVDESGHIFYPLAGKIHVRGKTLTQVRQLLTERLQRYFKEPQVDVNITEFRSQSVSVGGAVKQSGKFQLTNVPLTLVEAVAQAGGLTEQADAERIKWTHKGRERTVSLHDIVAHGDLSQNGLLADGDTVHVPTRADVPVYVMGEVGKQSVLTIGSNGSLSLTEALAQSSGINQNIANATGVFVIRNRPDRPDGKSIHVYQLNLQDATAYAMGTQFKLKPQDVVYVTAAPVARWNRVLSQIMPSVNSFLLLKNIF
nr:polysaccharide biosynthesis/export family protein [Conchiformibius kuhniae]